LTTKFIKSSKKIQKIHLSHQPQTR